MYLDRQTFLEKVKASGSRYWDEGKNYRWQYMEYVIDLLKELCPDDNKLCEVGTFGIPLSDKSFDMIYPVLDLDETPYRYNNTTFKNIIPDKSYKFFVALQVFEHLDKQPEAFREVMRISKVAILSFPYRWSWGDKRHKGITRDTINKWTCNIKPARENIINNRLILTWEF